MITLSLFEREPKASIKGMALNIEINKPQREYPFLPSRDISKQDWRGMDEALANLWEQKRFDIFIAYASLMRVIDRERVDNHDLIQSKKAREYATKQLQREHIDNLDIELQEVAFICLLYSDLRDSVFANNDKLWTQIYNFIAQNRDKRGTKAEPFFSYMLMELGNTSSLGTLVLPSLHRQLLHLAEQDMRDNKLFQCIVAFAKDRILFPDQYHQPDAKTMQVLVEFAHFDKNLFIDRRDFSTAYSRFIDHVAWLTILSADEVIRDSTGLLPVFNNAELAAASDRKLPPRKELS